MTAAVTPARKAALARCERAIRKGLARFFEVGAALMEIRDERLYLDTHTSFGAYCRERWSFSKQRGLQLIWASDVVADLATGVACPVPESEAQTRPLLPLPGPQRREVWQEATDQAGGAQPTSAAVAAIAARALAGLSAADKLRVVRSESEDLARRAAGRAEATETRAREVALAGCARHLRTAARAIRGQPEEDAVALWVDGGLAALEGEG